MRLADFYKEISLRDLGMVVHTHNIIFALGKQRQEGNYEFESSLELYTEREKHLELKI